VGQGNGAMLHSHAVIGANRIQFSVSTHVAFYRVRVFWVLSGINDEKLNDFIVPTKKKKKKTRLPVFFFFFFFKKKKKFNFFFFFLSI